MYTTTISPRLVGQVEERVRDPGGQIREAPLLQMEELVADPDLEAPLQDLDRLLLAVVDMKRGPALGRHFDDEVVKGATCVLTGDLEDEISPWTRLEAQAFAWR